jgi:hypothetical protein
LGFFELSFSASFVSTGKSKLKIVASFWRSPSFLPLYAGLTHAVPSKSGLSSSRKWMKKQNASQYRSSEAWKLQEAALANLSSG